MERIVCISFLLAIVVLCAGCSEKASNTEVQPTVSQTLAKDSNQNTTSMPFHNNTILTPLPAPQPPLPSIAKWEVELMGEEREEIINLVLNDTKVKGWLEEGYDIVNVTRSDDTAWVYILTQKQIPPWIVGITLVVPVDLRNKRVEGEVINFRLTLASLTEEQKEKAKRIALSDPEVRERIGSEYEVTGAEVVGYSICYKGCHPEAHPAVFIKSNPGPCRYGMDFTILVDLREEKVVDILSYYRKPSPECLNST